MDYLERISHPVFNFLVTDISAFVEEPGEISFGVLGNLESRSGDQPDNFDVFRGHFQLLHTYITTFNLLSGVDDLRPSKFTEYGDDSLETVMLNAWLLKLIEDCESSTFRPYSLAKYKATNISIYRDVELEDASFTTSCIADDFPIAEVIDSVEVMITTVHRLWNAKRKTWWIARHVIHQ